MIKKLDISKLQDQRKILRNHKRSIIGIYLIANPDDKVYIGQSKNIKQRFEEHKKSSKKDLSTKLVLSLREYGTEFHRFIILEECRVDQLNERERFYQDLYDATANLNHNLSKIS